MNCVHTSWDFITSLAHCPCTTAIGYHIKQRGTTWFGLTTGSCSEPEKKGERILFVLVIFKTGRKKKGLNIKQTGTIVLC